MGNLNFDNGLVSYEVNGVPNAVVFNPADMSFVDKLLNFFEVYSKKHDTLSRDIQNLEDNRKIFELCDNMDKEIRTSINTLFGENASENLFPDMSCCAMANGLPLWMNFTLAVMEEVQQACDSQKTKLNPRIQKLVAKYKK